MMFESAKENNQPAKVGEDVHTKGMHHSWRTSKRHGEELLNFYH